MERTKRTYPAFPKDIGIKKRDGIRGKYVLIIISFILLILIFGSIEWILLKRAFDSDEVFDSIICTWIKQEDSDIYSICLITVQIKNIENGDDIHILAIIETYVIVWKEPQKYSLDLLDNENQGLFTGMVNAMSRDQSFFITIVAQNDGKEYHHYFSINPYTDYEADL